jgi:FkbM family methyltransferase
MFLFEALADLRSRARYGWLMVRNPSTYDYHGVVVPLRTTPELRKSRRSIFRGTYEAPEISTLSKLLKPDDVVLELGGGCGVVSAYIGRQLSDSRNLYTVEANSRMIPSIESVAQANSLQTNVIHAAASLSEGPIEFFFDAEFLSSSATDRGKGAEKRVVQGKSIYDLLRDIKPTVLVADVEGAEAELLTIEMPPSIRLIVAEIHPHVIGDKAASDIVKSLLLQGFELHIDQCAGRALAFMRPVHRCG